eukprot:SAG31_NODE_924_length_10963_cov_4.339286_11_plen_47_part_00
MHTHSRARQSQTERKVRVRLQLSDICDAGGSRYGMGSAQLVGTGQS